MPEFDAEKSRSERDKGMARALRASATFADYMGRFIINLPHGTTWTGEDILRAYRNQKYGPEPNDPHAWGGVMNGAIRNGFLVKTGKRKHMKKTTSHARSTDVYVRT